MSNIYKIYYSFFMLFLSSSISWGQSNSMDYCDSLWYADNYSIDNVLAQTFHNTYPALQGQYYLNWALGTVYYADGRIIRNQYLRYHSYSDNIHWQRQSDLVVGEIPKSSIEKVMLHTDKNQYVLYKKVELRLPLSFNSSEVLLQILNQGDIALCCYRKAKYIKNSEEGFYTDHQYYLQKDAAYNPISLSKSRLLAQFNKEEKLQIKTLIKDNKLKLKREADMIKAIDIINEIINN